MSDLYTSLAAEGVKPLMWCGAGVVAAFTLFVGITLAVALFHPQAAIREHAKEILRDLLSVFRPTVLVRAREPDRRQHRAEQRRQRGHRPSLPGAGGELAGD